MIKSYKFFSLLRDFNQSNYVSDLNAWSESLDVERLALLDRHLEVLSHLRTDQEMPGLKGEFIENLSFDKWRSPMSILKSLSYNPGKIILRCFLTNV